MNTFDFVKDMPSMKSFNGTNSKGLEMQMKSKWQVERAFNNKQIMMPQDTKGLVMLYGPKKNSLDQSIFDSFD